MTDIVRTTDSEEEMKDRPLEYTEAARLRGDANEMNNSELLTQEKLRAVREFMATAPDETFASIAEIVNDISNIRANSARFDLIDKVAESVAEALGLDDEDERVTDIEDAVFESVHAVFLDAFGEA